MTRMTIEYDVALRMTETAVYHLKADTRYEPTLRKLLKWLEKHQHKTVTIQVGPKPPKPPKEVNTI